MCVQALDIPVRHHFLIACARFPWGRRRANPNSNSLLACIPSAVTPGEMMAIHMWSTFNVYSNACIGHVSVIYFSTMNNTMQTLSIVLGNDKQLWTFALMKICAINHSLIMVRDWSVIVAFEFMKHFPRYWSFVRGIYWSMVDSLDKGHWHKALMFTLICAWTNNWARTLDAVD